MAYASITYTSASGTTFALTNSSGDPIEYLRQSDIAVTVNGTLKTQGTDYTFNSAGTAIVLATAVTSATVVISRTTSITDATVSFTAGSTLTAQDLNNSDKQNRFALQEFSDTYGAITTGTGDLSTLGGFIGSAETWVADNAHAATTGAIDVRVDSKIDTALTGDVVAGNAITITDNSPASGQITIAVTDGSIEAAELASNAVTTAKINDSAVTTAKIQDGAVTNAKLADTELQTLAGIGSDQASSLVALTNAEIQTLDGITASTAELNQLDGITVSTSFSNSATQIATSSAINSFVTNLLDSLGGFVAIPDDQSFPTTNPDPSDNAGTVVSIADAGGLVVDSSGVSTTGRTTGGSVVTITGFPTVYRNSTLLSGLGIQVQTTTTLNTYTYHKSLPTDADIAQLNDDVNDFFARYRISATNPTINNDVGDLVFNTTANELRVFNGTDWQGGVTATGNLVSKAGDTMTGALGVTAGTAGSPSVFISGDTNTGLYSPGADQVAISTGGTGRLTIDSSGNVNIDSGTVYIDAANNRLGVGTTTPGATLDCNGSIRAISASPVIPSSGAGLEIYYASGTFNGTPSAYLLSYDRTGAVYKPINIDASEQVFRTSGSEKMRLTSTGLGIGTSSVDSPLHINAASYATASNGTVLLKSTTSASNDGSQITFGTDAGRHAAIAGRTESGTIAGYLQLGTRGSSGDILERVRIDSSGRVGIGTSSPGGNLTVTDASTYTLNVNANAGGAGALLSTVGGSASLALGTNSTERVRITAAGNLGVGTTSPSGKLTVSGNAIGTTVALTDAATVAVDLSLANYFTLTLGGNRTLGAPSNQTAGQSGVIVITQDGTGSRTLAYNSVYKFPGGTVPTLTTTANAVDVLVYYVESATRITCRLLSDLK